MIRRPPRSTLSSSSAASDVYKRQELTQDLEKERENSEQLRVQAGAMEDRLEELEQLKQELEKFKDSMRQKETEVGEFAGETEQLQKQLKQQVQYSQTLQSEVESLNAVMAMRAEKEKDRKNEEVKMLKEVYETDMARLKHRTEELEAALEVKGDKLQRLMVSIVEGEQKLEAAHAVEVQLQADVSHLKHQLEAAEIVPTPRSKKISEEDAIPLSGSQARNGTAEVRSGEDPGCSARRPILMSDDDDL
eukprot:TRINITY_DN24615_c0_g1_i2.p1 TRINITY_DN24615_c0_g1~~TRINITY_DN24615_c0_g1_i2.p1  ORF type:complete len:248 (+),score=103.05 TRINITY_DN24615_c0_g1_i2:89-832(+)